MLLRFVQTLEECTTPWGYIFKCGNVFSVHLCNSRLEITQTYEKTFPDMETKLHGERVTSRLYFFSVCTTSDWQKNKFCANQKRKLFLKCELSGKKHCTSEKWSVTVFSFFFFIKSVQCKGVSLDIRTLTPWISKVDFDIHTNQRSYVVKGWLCKGRMWSKVDFTKSTFHHIRPLVCMDVKVDLWNPGGQSPYV